MSNDFNLRSKTYWKRFSWGILLGFLSAIMALIFILIMDWGQAIFFTAETRDWALLSGPWWIVLIMTIAGFIVGLLRRYAHAKELDAFGSIEKGYMDPKPVPSSVFASLISLVAGFSLGPEVTTGMISAGFASWISKKKNLDDSTTRTNVLSSIAGAWGGLFSSPPAMIIIMLESKHKQSTIYYGILLIAGLAAVIGFGIFYAFNDFNYSSLLGVLAPPAYELRLWHLGLSVLLGIIAVPFALVFVLFNKMFSKLLEPLKGKPVLVSTLGGVWLGLLGVVIPITIGLGSTEMPIITQQAAEIGFLLLIVFALAKILALSGALSFGFIGGPIFPLLFVGTCLGSAINQMFPQIPLGLALGCMIVGVPAALVPIPLALGLIGIIVIGLSPNNVLPVFVTALVAFSVTRGLILGGKEPTVV